MDRIKAKGKRQRVKGKEDMAIGTVSLLPFAFLLSCPTLLISFFA
jgi:hypothetical protein